MIIAIPALIKMSQHAESGGNIEIMGLLQGKVRGDAFLITDCFRLPVEGTETRVNAGEAANEFMIRFTELNELTRFSKDSVLGWYHSHPGYGCWLSGIDVATQSMYQSHQDPFVAVVIDPLRSQTAGRVEIGAFRTFPEGFNPDTRTRRDNKIPYDKAQDFGMHHNRYYSLEVEYYKSETDQLVLNMLYKGQWAQMLGASSLRQARESLVQNFSEALDKVKDENEPDLKRFVRKIGKCCDNVIAETSRELLRNFLLNGRTTDRQH